MNNPIIYTGNNIQQSHTEVLKPIGLFALYERIRGNLELREEVERLRKVAAIDKSAYQRVKTRLPYFCCSTFENGIRKGDQFQSVTCFVMDIDKLPYDQIDSMKSDLRNDPRVKMLFVSPGGQGIKVIFELTTACTSLKEYSDFYKTFSYHIMEAFKLQSYLDTTTCDATRVSFLSFDEDAYYNTMNEPVFLKDYIPDSVFTKPNIELFNVENSIKEQQEELPEELYKDILQKLNPDVRILKREKQIFIPEALNKIQIPIAAEIEKLGLKIKEIKDINYGKKIIIELGFRFGEVNLFYGRHGFSVVQSPKSGSDPQLNKIGEVVVRKVLASAVENEHALIPTTNVVN